MRRTALALAALTLVGAAACGGDADQPDSGAEVAPATGAPASVPSQEELPNSDW